MLPFLVPSRRRKKVEWLMDHYVEAKVLYPNARFSYIGHSNGTYLVARAFELYSGCRFENVVFAGSVVRRSYDWGRAIQAGQVDAVLNYVAAADRVVAYLPAAWELIRIQDVGSAGHNGFEQAGREGSKLGQRSFPQGDQRQGWLYERGYLPGGHEAALVERNWDDIAQFIVNGVPAQNPAITVLSKQEPVVAAVGAVSPLLWVALPVLLLLISWLIWIQPWISPEWARTLLLVAFVWSIWKVLTWI